MKGPFMRHFRPKPLPLAGAIAVALFGLNSPHAQPLPAGALPTNGQVVQGSAAISQSANALTVNQSSQRLITHWDTFNIGSGARVDFIQPSRSSIALNRVMSSDPSRIYGQLNANGQVFLVNPNGVLFGAGSRVNVGGLVASTLDISDADFNAGNFRFAGSSQAEVANEGEIVTPNGGYAALLGARVRNAGSIVARLGTVALGAGQAMTLDMNGDGLINLQIDAAAANAITANSGALRADGGTVILAARGTDPLATVLNNTGTVHAVTLENRNGVIRLEGGDTGIVASSGVLDASGRGAGETGGTVKVLGDKVGLFDAARIDASGDAGGGTVLVGGNWQGGGTEKRASATYVGAETKIAADAVTAGNGGTVVVWADGTTRFAGNITARGGAQGGNGGKVETSGKESLSLTGMADASAANGKAGEWLLDPRNVTIVATGGALAAGVFTPAVDDAQIGVDTILAALNGGTNVSITTGATGTQAGDITVNAAIDYTGSSDRGLTLTAARDVAVSKDIKATGTGKLDITITATAGRVTLGDNAGAQEVVASNGGNINITGGGRTGVNSILMQGARVQSDAGTINMTANAGGTLSAMSLQNASATNQILSTTGAINITANGNAGGTGLNVTSGNNTIASQGGDITITGTTTGAANAVNFSSTGINEVSNTGAGNITIIGTNTNTTSDTGNRGLNITPSGGSVLFQVQNGALAIRTTGGTGATNVMTIAPTGGSVTMRTTGSGSITLESNSINLGGGAGSVSLQNTGTGSLILQPLTNGTSVGIGGGGGTFNLTAAELATIQDGFSSITIGRATGTGAMNVATATFADNLVLRQASGGITFSGDLNLGANNLTVQTGAGIAQSAGSITVGGLTSLAAGAAADISLGQAANDFGGAVSATSRDLTLADANALVLGATAAGRDVSITTAGNISQTGALAVTGNTTLAAGASGDITLANASNNFTGAVGITSARHVQLTDANALALAASTVSGNFAVTTNGQLTQTGVLNIAGGLTVTTQQVAGDVIMNNSGAASTVLGDTRIGNNYDLTTGGAISQAGGTTLVVGNNFTVAGGNLAAPAAGNVIGGLDNSGGTGSVIRQVGKIDLSQQDIGSGLGNITTGGNLSVQSLASADTIAAKVGAGTNAVNLNLANNIGGAISITSSAPTVTPSGAPVETGISQKGATINVGGTASFSAATSAANAGGKAGNIVLDGLGNVFGGLVSFSGHDVTIRGAGPMMLGSSAATGNLDLRAGSIAGTSQLKIDGTTLLTVDDAGGTVSLSNAANDFAGTVTVAGASPGTVSLSDANSLTLHTAGALDLGATNVAADLALKAGGAITQSGALSVGGSLAIETTHAAGDVTIANGVDTKLGNSFVGGDFNVVATGKAITQNAATVIKAAGDFNTTGASSSTNAADNLIGGADNSLGGGVIVKQVGIVELGNITTASNLTVISQASGQSFAGPAIHGNAVTLNNAANSIGGTISVTTVAPAINAAGAPVATGITQAAGTSIQVGGTSNFAAGSGNITVANAGNTFGGAVAASGKNITLGATGALQLGTIAAAGNFSATATAGITQNAALQVMGTSSFNGGAGAVALTNAGNDFGGAVSASNTAGLITIVDANAVTLGTVDAAGALTVTAGGTTTLTGNVTGTGVTFNGAGAGAVALGGNSVVSARTGNITMGAMAGGANNLTLIGDAVALSGNWTGTGNYVLQPFTASTTVGIAGGAGTFNLTAAEMANIGSAAASQVTIGRADGTGTVTANALTFDDRLALLGGAIDFVGAHNYGNGISAIGNGRVRINNAVVTATGGDVYMKGTSDTGTAFSMGSGTNTVQALGSGNVTIIGLQTGAGTGFGISIGSGGTNTIRVADGTLTVQAHSAGTQSAMSMGSGTNTIEATGAGSMNVTATSATPGADAVNGISIGTGGTNTLRTASGNLAIVAQGSGSGHGFSMGSGTNTVRSASGDVSVTGTSTGTGHGVSMATGDNLMQAGGAGNLTVSGQSLAADGGYGVNLGTAASGGTNALRVTDGTLTVNAASAGTRAAFSMGTIDNRVEAILGGSVRVNAIATGSANGIAMGSSGINTIRAASGDVTLDGTATGGGNGFSMGSGTNVVEAGGSGNVFVTGNSTSSVEGFGVSMGSGGNNTIRVAEGAAVVKGYSAGDETALSIGSGTNVVEATGAGRVELEGTGTASNGVSLGSGGTNTVRTVSGRLDIKGTGGGSFGDGVVLSDGNITVQSSSGAINLTGHATGRANGVFIDTEGAVNVLTQTGPITVTGSAAGPGTAIAFRPDGGTARIEASGAGDITFRADSYDSAPLNGGTMRIASAGGVLGIYQLTPGVSIGIGDGAFGALNWSPAEIAQVDGFRLVRVGNRESGALDLRPPWFPFPVERPPASRTGQQLQLDAVLATIGSMVGSDPAPRLAPASLQAPRRLSFTVQGFDDEKRKR